MDNQLFLSIIIPVYNMEHYIVPCLESIFANRDIDKNLFEVIVVNDGSTDMSYRLVEEYRTIHQNFHIELLNQESIDTGKNTFFKGFYKSKMWLF